MIKKGWNVGRKLPGRSGFAALAVATLLAPALATAQQPSQPDPAEVAAFEQVWQRADLPVAQGVAKRSWLWGPQARDNRTEPLVESPGGKRQVRYFDKSRMEINDPNGDPKSPWFVTNGLLVVEMISGHMQVGYNTFEPRQPAQIPVAGDLMTMGPQPVTPSYATLARVATVDTNQNRSQPRTGQDVREVLSIDGSVHTGAPEGVGRLPKLQQYESMTGHNIPDVFWAYMNQRGTVYENGQYRDGQLFNWLYAMGYPLTEPYWITIEVQGRKMPVMMQAFQRRILTYNPANVAEWRVEMGNVGLQYHEWRYGTAPAPTPGPKNDIVPLKVRHVESGSNNQFSAIHEPLYTAIANQQDWQAIWNRHTMAMNPLNTPPSVDFKNEFVIAAFWGDKPDACYDLNVTGVSVQDKTLTVKVARIQSDRVCATVLTQPHDFAVVSKAGLPASSSLTKYNVVFVDGNKAFTTTEVTLP
jgi:hypothetical protein